MKVPSETMCPECNGPHIINDGDLGETICNNCGFVIEQEIAYNGPEWRAFTLKENQSRRRVGQPINFSVYDKGLSTFIGKENRDFSGRKLSSSLQYRVSILKKWEKRFWISTGKEQNLSQAMAELDRLSDKMYISKVVQEKAAIIYRKALERGLIKGRTIVALIAASLYAACRVTKTPRRLEEISTFSLVEKKEITRCYRFLIRELNIRIPLVDPLTYISTIGEKISISGSTLGLAVRIFHEAKEKCILTGKDPKGIAAAVLYIACRQSGEKVRQQDIAIVANISEVTIRNRIKGIMKEINL
jgi:transcription initiation factor TFIIB